MLLCTVKEAYLKHTTNNAQNYLLIYESPNHYEQKALRLAWKVSIRKCNRHQLGRICYTQ